MGTPAYMAPEQLDGGKSGPLSDQYSFAVTLYEALVGARPFAGTTLKEHLEHARAEKYQPLPPQDATPAWLLRTLRRALAPRPEARFASVADLLSALRKDPSVRRARLAAAALVLLAGVSATTLFLHHRNAEVRACEAIPDALHGIWDEPAHAEVRAAYGRSNLPYAPAALKLVEHTLDTQARAWAEMSVDACKATRVRHEQTQATLTLRSSCLDERLDQLRALSELFRSADIKTVQRTGQVTENILPLDVCANLSALQAQPKLPDDPSLRAQVASLRTRVGQAQVLMDAGRYAQSAAAFERLLPESVKLAFLPLQARVEMLLGLIDYRGGKTDLTHRYEGDAFSHALEVGDEATASKAAQTLSSAYLEEANLELCGQWARVGLALARRTKEPLIIAANYSNAMAALEAKAGHDAASKHWDQLAEELIPMHRGTETVTSLSIVYNSAVHRFDLGDYASTATTLEQLLPTALQVLGPGHPFISFCEEQLVEAYQALGQQDKAEETLAQMRDNIRTGQMMDAVGFLLAEAQLRLSLGQVLAGEPERALSGLAPLEAQLAGGPEGTRYTLARGMRALAMLEEGNLAGAKEILARNAQLVGNTRPTLAPEDLVIAQATGVALQREEKASEAVTLLTNIVGKASNELGSEQPPVLWSKLDLAQALANAGELRRARELVTRTLPVLQKRVGTDNPELALAFVTRGQAAAREEDCAAAEPDLRRALLLLEQRPHRHDLRAVASEGLSHCLEKLGKDADQVEPLRARAARELEDAGPSLMKTERKRLVLVVAGKALKASAPSEPPARQ